MSARSTTSATPASPARPADEFQTVLLAEIDEIRRSRALQAALEPPPALPPPSDPASRRDAFSRAHGERMTGLALSGGGIRSATFNLGLIQGLAEKGVLGTFDYLSTVSGGGYIGAWLSAWTHRQGGVRQVESFLERRGAEDGDRESEPGPIRFLRAYSNYLTPRLGLFSFDTWAMVAIYLRNFLLNLTILAALFSSLLLVPRLAVHGFHAARTPNLWLALTGACLFVGIAGIGFNMRRFAIRRESGRPEWVSLFVIAPLAAGSLFATLAFTTSIAAVGCVDDADAPWWIATRGSLYLVAWVFGYLFSFIAFSKRAAPGSGSAVETSRGPKLLPFLASTAITSLLVFGPLLFAFRRLLERLLLDGDRDRATVLATILGAPAVLLILLLAGVVHLGLAGRSFSDDRREWVSRVGGWLMVCLVVWLAASAIALLAPFVVATAAAKLALGGGWIVSTLVGVLGGKNPNTGQPGKPSKLDLVLRVAPSLFALGLLVVLSAGLDRFFRTAPPNEPTTAAVAAPERTLVVASPGTRVVVEPKRSAEPAPSFGAHLDAIAASTDDWRRIAIAALVLLAIALALAWRVDVNEFSMHLFYRNRLVRCYLGASVENRTEHANPFTGFSLWDDLALARLRTIPPANPDESAGAHPEAAHIGPYPIVNAALNLVQGRNLAWQERKAANFALTPLYAGFDLPRTAADDEGRSGAGVPPRRGAFRPTEEYGGGVTLGTALAISGAAASPNMGYHTSPALSFLLTVFDVRLGWWLGNPRRPATWRRSGPSLAFGPLLGELLGKTNDEAEYVYLSDGGHFENLGIYELVKRRCRLIVAADCGADRDLEFGDLGNAIRKCRNDLGIEIEIDTAPIRPDEAGMSSAQFALGRVRYDLVDGPDAPIGTIVLVKPSLTRAEAPDILDYKARHAAFPQETTGDQFFTESQFESYRKLGASIACRIFEEPVEQLGEKPVRGDLTRLIETLEAVHAPRRSTGQGADDRA